MNRLALLLALAVMVGSVVSPRPARACTPIGGIPHFVDPSKKASDQTPPMLPAIQSPEIERWEGSGDCRGTCGAVGVISFAAEATDDMTAANAIGYRFSLESGAFPDGHAFRDTTLDPEGDFVRLYIDPDDIDEDFDVTLRVVAIDLAGNESAPQTVRVQNDRGGACAIAPGRAWHRPLVWLALAALLVATRRLRRRPS